MSLHIYMGAPKSGKTSTMLRSVIESSMQEPSRNFIILVPEQFTMQTQKSLVSMHPRGGILNIDVLSFERLAYRVCAEGNTDGLVRMEEIGKSYVLQRLVQQHKKELVALGAGINKPGYIYELKSLVSEFLQYDVNPDRLREVQRSDEAMGDTLKRKLGDVTLIYESFLRYLEGSYVTAEGVISELADMVCDSDLLCDSTIILDGYTGFTPIQYRLITQLMKVCRDISISMTIDGQEDPFLDDGPHRLFALSKKTIRTLSKIAKENRIETELHRLDVRAGGDDALGFLRSRLFRYDSGNYTPQTDAVVIREAANPLQEVQQTVREIRRLVRTKGLRYRDIAVITGDLAQYGNYFGQVLNSTDIPHFIDEKRLIAGNYFVAYIRSLLAVVTDQYSYESVFAYLRNRLCNVPSRSVDVLENYVLERGIRGRKRWNEQWEQEDTSRALVIDEIGDVTEALRGRGKTVRERTEALYLHIERMQIEKKLEDQAAVFDERGELSLAREYRQVYEMVMELFDKLVTVLGDENISLTDYRALLEAGFAEGKIGIIPPSTDQVLIGDMQRSRLQNVKVLFFVGVNEGLIPKSVSTGGILSERDRELLLGDDLELKPNAREEIYTQKFYLYLSLSKPTQQLVLSYSRANAEGEASRAAYLIPVLEAMYPGIRVERDPDAMIDRIEMPDEAMQELTVQLCDMAQTEPLPDWKELYSWFARQSAYDQRLDNLTRAVCTSKPVDRIGKTVARAIYGDSVSGSTTRLELFASCAFAHFAKYGLGLSERREYEWQSMDLGNIVHRALEAFSKSVQKQGIAWQDITDEARKDLVESSVDTVAAQYGDQILQSSARNHYMTDRVKRIVDRTVWALQQQIARGDFVPAGFEVDFDTPVRGRIDRMDLCERDNHVYVKVVDYKTGQVSFDPVELYYGLQMQLVVYLNAALTQTASDKANEDKEVLPGGIFYYQVQDPILDDVLGETETQRMERILTKLRVGGLFSTDTEVIESLDHTLEPGGNSSVIPLKYAKDGRPDARSKSSMASREEFRVMCDYTQREIARLKEKIMDGDVDIDPYQYKKKSSCTFCPYRTLCGFDERIPGYSYRELDSEGVSKETVWKKMSEDEQ